MLWLGAAEMELDCRSFLDGGLPLVMKVGTGQRIGDGDGRREIKQSITVMGNVFLTGEKRVVQHPTK